LPVVHAGNETFLLCAQTYPDSEMERLKCYDQETVSSAFGLHQYFREAHFRVKRLRLAQTQLFLLLPFQAAPGVHTLRGLGI